MDWFTLILASVFTISASNILQKIMLKDDKSDPLAYSFVFQLLSGCVVLLVTLVTGFTMPPVDRFAGYFLLMGLLYALATYFYFRALQLIDLSQVVILHSTRAFWTMVGAVVFLGEVISFRQLAGALIIFSAIVLVMFKKGSFILNKGVWFALAGGACIGLALILDSFLLGFSEQYSYAVVAFFIPAILLFLININNLQAIKQASTGKTLLKIFPAAALFGISVLLIYGSIGAGGNASQIMPIGLSSTILIVLLSAFLLHEKDELGKKLIGAVLVIAGVMLLK